MTESQAKTKRTGSVVGSLASVESKGKPRSYPLWPEFNENDINAEKWEGNPKSKEKGKSPNLQFYDDQEGKIDLPSSIKVDHWKRPQDFIASKIPVVVDNENFIDLMHPNEHLCHSQLMRTIISQMMILWDISRTKTSKSENAEINPWLPWEHIYSLCKAGKGHMPLHNQYGKYVVRLYWMGAWRKITVDDLMPFDLDGKLLLPMSTSDHELWPMLLSKALIKIAAIDYNFASSDSPEIGDYFVIQCLTGWIPEIIPLQTSHNHSVWELMKKLLPEWKLPGEKEKTSESGKETSAPTTLSAKPTESTKNEHPSGVAKAEKPDKGSGKEGKGGKESSKKRDEKEKSKSRPHSARSISARSGADKSVVDEPVVLRPEDVQTAVFATFSQQHTSPAPMTLLRDMADSSEQLRKLGLSHLHTHPVFLSQSRSCSLIPPVPVPEVPRWKLIRPHRKKVPPTDEPQPTPEPPKPDQWLEIISPFIGYRPPLNIPDSAASASAGSFLLDEADEERELADKVTKPRMPSTRNSKRSDHASSRKGGNLDGLSHPTPSSPALHSKVGSAEDLSAKGEEEEEQEQAAEEEGEVAVMPAEEDVLKKSWVDFDDFCKSFTNVVIFHKPNTYPYNEHMTEFKQLALSAGTNPVQTGKKGSAQTNQVASNTNITRNAHSPVVPRIFESMFNEERVPSFLFVDSVAQTELIVNYSVLPRWFGLEEKKLSDKESVAGASEAVSYKHDPNIPSGILVVEQYTWKSLVTGQPLLRIKTTGTKAACLTLPAGRHVLRFVFSSPLGYHVHICSTTKFVFGDEDTVMLPLKEESCRFVETASHIMSSVDKCLETFGNKTEFQSACKELRKAYMPSPAINKHELQRHHAAWHKAFYSTILAAIGDAKTGDLVFALRVFLMDLDPASVTEITTDVSRETADWGDRKPIPEENLAAELIQRNWRGAFTRKMMKGLHYVDSKEHQNTSEVLKSVRSALHTNVHTYSLMLLRNLLKNYPELIGKFPFYKDEWNKIAYTDYMGTYSEQPPRTWFVVFREVFYVEQDSLCVPKIYVPIPTCMLRVINNDTGVEMKKVFQKVAPQLYTKNKRGYTFVAEARTFDQPLAAGKWKLRLIGSNAPLPTPLNTQINSVFSSKEIRDYYIPNKAHILFRYTLKCNCNLVGSLQLQTSKSEAVVLFKIFDNDEELISVRGKGHCVIPAFYFQTNNKERITSGNSNETKVSPGAPATKGGGGSKKGALSGKKGDGKVSPVPPKEKKVEPVEVPEYDPNDDNTYAHNYVIQAVVERKTWPLTRGQWAYVEKLKEAEKEELKAFSGGQRQSQAQKPGAQVDKGKKGAKAVAEKGGKDKKQGEREIGSRPSSQNIVDETCANWSLRFITDVDVAEEVELKKDTHRQEEIRALKQAWEAAEPGRAVKAMQSRLNFLSNNAIKSESSDKENEEDDDKVATGEKTDVNSDVNLLEETELLFNPPPFVTQKDLLKPFDATPYIRPLLPGAYPYYVNPDDLAVLEENEQRKKVEEHNEKRTKTQAYRDQNRSERQILKEQQLDACQDMQFAMDLARTELLKPRESYRQRLLEEKRLKDEAAEAAAAAALAASETTSPDTKRKSGKKKK